MLRTSPDPMLLSLTFLACAGLAGCGRNTPPSPHESLRTSSAASAESAGESLAGAASAQGSSTRETVGDRRSQTASATSAAFPDDSAVRDAQTRRLFDSLVSPGSPQEDWDQTLEQLLAEGESATRVLAEKLTSGTNPEREMAATTLALLGPQAAAAAAQLEQALGDSLPFVQANAAATLIQLPEHAQKAIPALTRMLQADDPQLRQLAAVNLNAAQVVLAEHVVPLRQVLQQEQSNDVLTPVVELLGRIGKPAESALPELRKIAGEQSGDLGAAAQSAIQLISGETDASTTSP